MTKVYCGIFQEYTTRIWKGDENWLYILIKIGVQQFCQTLKVIVAEIACGCVSIFHQSLVEFGRISSLGVGNINQHCRCTYNQHQATKLATGAMLASDYRPWQKQFSAQHFRRSKPCRTVGSGTSDWLTTVADCQQWHGASVTLDDAVWQSRDGIETWGTEMGACRCVGTFGGTWTTILFLHLMWSTLTHIFMQCFWGAQEWVGKISGHGRHNDGLK